MPTETVQVVIQKLPDVVTYGIVALVAIGLIGLMLLFKLLNKEPKAVSTEVQVAPVVIPAVQAAPAAEVIPNRGELVAAVSAALAEELGTDVSAIRILSIKRVG